MADTAGLASLFLPSEPTAVQGGYETKDPFRKHLLGRNLTPTIASVFLFAAAIEAAKFNGNTFKSPRKA